MISIILPVYNGEKYICAAIESVIEQNYSNWELLIIDDGSTDSTAVLVKNFLNEKVHYIYQSNQGPSAARNRGIDFAKGDYVCFIDADDIYIQGKLIEQVTFLEQHPEIDIVYPDIQVVNESLENLYTLKSEGTYSTKEDFLAMLLFRQIIPLPQSIMVRKKCFLDKIRYNEHYVNGEDYDLIIQLAKRFKFGYLPKKLYIYRRHEDNLTNNHLKQIEAEQKILQSVGYSDIENTIEKSTFPFNEKRLLLAKIYLKLNDYQQSYDVLYNLYQHQNKNSLVCFYLGNCSYLLNDLFYAKKYYKEAIINQKNMAEAYNNLGCVYGLIGEIDKANIMFETALTIRISYIDALYNREQLKMENPSWKITLRELRKTLTTYAN